MIANLEALRALAAWMVVAHHLRGPMGAFWPPLGETLVFAAGVDVFFVLSGVVMVISTAGRGMRPGAFLARRIARIGPLWWAATLGLTLALSLGLRPVGVSAWDAGDVMASLLLWPDMRADGFPGPLLPVGWTLTCEAGFYALFGAALIFGARAPLVAVAGLAALAGVGAFIPAESAFTLRAWTAPLMLEFAAGVLVGKWWSRGGSGAGVVWRPCLAIAVAGLALGAARLAIVAPDGDLITPDGAGAAWRVICFGAPAAALVAAALAAEGSGVRAASRFLQTQGAASYAVYLLHLPLIQLIGKAGFGPAAALFAAPPAIALAAHLAHVHFEAPLVARLRKRLCGATARRGMALGAGSASGGSL